MKYDSKTSRENSQETQRCQDFRRKFSDRIKISIKSYIKIKRISLFLQIFKLFRFKFSSDLVHIKKLVKKKTHFLS